jgi:predicted RNA methylase
MNVARTLYLAGESFQDIAGRTIGDLGCGPGIFTVGSMLLGSRYGDMLNLYIGMIFKGYL